MVYVFMLIQRYSLGIVVRYGFLSKGNGIIDIMQIFSIIKEKEQVNMDIINLTINIKFCRISYHEKDWVEKKQSVITLYGILFPGDWPCK